MALDFDGSNDQVNYGDLAAFDGASALTIMCWHIFDALAANAVPLGKTTTIEWQVVSATGDWFCVFNAQTGKVIDVFDSQSLRHFATVYNGAGAANADRLKMYINGVNQTVDFSGTTIPATTDVSANIFEVGGVAGVFANEKVSHLKVWTAALTADEVAAEMWSYLPVRKTNLLIWSPFDDEVQARDYSGNGNHGTVVDAPVQATGPAGVSYGSGVIARRAHLRTGSSKRDSFRRLGALVPRFPRGV